MRERVTLSMRETERDIEGVNMREGGGARNRVRIYIYICIYIYIYIYIYI